MSQLDQIVSVTVTSAASPVTQASFSVPLIVGSSNPAWTDGAKVHVYTSPAGMLTDGYAITSPEYLDAAAMYSGSVAPSFFMVCPRQSTSAPQIDTFLAATVATGNVFSFTLNGTVCTYTAVSGDTGQQVLAALSAQATATNLVTALISNSGSNKLLTLTGVTPGVALTYSAISSNLTHTVTAATGIASDLANALTDNNAVKAGGWYGLLTPGAADSDILQAAAWVQGNKKLYVAQSSTSSVLTSGSLDIGSQLNTAGYTRTSLVYNGQGGHTAAAWMGLNLPLTPGSNNWNLSTLPGQAPDMLTDTQVAVAFGKDVNVYQAVGGVSVMRYGTTASGQFIDVTIGVDWLQSTIQTNIYQILANAAALGKKIPYTDVGSAQIAQGVRMALAQGARNGLINEQQPIVVSTTSVANTPTTQRAKRICPNITFSAVLQGAVNTVVVQGTVSV